ncbi:MAG: hypothetical protein ACXWP4_04425 [Polyangiales bacterium]
MRDLAAALTDVLLASVGTIVVLACASRKTAATRVGALGVLASVVAAILGAFRFLGVVGVTSQHLVAVHVAATVGMPMIGLSFVLASARPVHPRRMAGVVLVVLIALSLAFRGPGFRTIAGAAGMIATAVAAGALARRDRLTGVAGAAGAVLVMIDGLVIGGPGDLWCMSRTAWFHVLFAVAIGSLGFAMRRADSPA